MCVFIYFLKGMNFIMKKLFLSLKNLDKNTIKIMKSGYIFSAIICLSAVAILLSYIFSGNNLFYHIGLLLMKSGFTFTVEFFICGIIVDSLKKSII